LCFFCGRTADARLANRFLLKTYFKTSGVIGRQKTPWTSDTTNLWRSGAFAVANKTKNRTYEDDQEP
jgi:hypothetical protein